MGPGTHVTIVHPHKSVVLERMAIAFSKAAFGCGSYVSEYQSRMSLWGKPLQIDTIPRWKSRSEYARIEPELRVSVPAYTEAITIDGPPGVEAQP